MRKRFFMTFLILAVSLILASGLRAEPGVTDDTILVGSTNSLSGPLTYAGTEMTKYGIDLYLNVINEQGGINGRKIKIIFYDDAYNPAQSLANAKKLVESDKVFCLLINQGAATSMAILPYIEKEKVPLFFPFGSIEQLKGRRYVFRGFTEYATGAEIIVDYVVNEMKKTKIGLLYQDDEYGKEGLAAIETRLKKYNLKIHAAEPAKRASIDLSPQITKLKAADPEVVILYTIPNPSAMALKEAQKIGWTGGSTIFFASGPLTEEQFLKLAGSASEGIYGLSLFPHPYSDEPAVKLYRERLQKYFPGHEPNRYSLLGYIYTMIFVEGLKRAGKNLTREGLVDTMERIKNFDTGLISPVSFGPGDHDAQKDGFVAKVKNYRWESVTGWIKKRP